MNPAAALILAGILGVAGAAMGWLTRGAAAAAVLVGTTVLWASGLPGGTLLGLFFISGSLLTSTRNRSKAGHRRPGGRIWSQVVANGGWAAAGAVLIPSQPAVGWPLLVGALAAAQADTWGTELGRLSRYPPRLITSGRVVDHGTSGGVTWLGSAAGVAGAGLMAAAALLVSVPATIAAAGLAGGVVGTLADSVLGATVQGRYHCAACGGEVERVAHGCPGEAKHTRGIRWIDNDVVNLLGTAAGAGSALVIANLL